MTRERKVDPLDIMAQNEAEFEEAVRKRIDDPNVPTNDKLQAVAVMGIMKVIDSTISAANMAGPNIGMLYVSIVASIVASAGGRFESNNAIAALLYGVIEAMTAEELAPECRQKMLKTLEELLGPPQYGKDHSLLPN